MVVWWYYKSTQIQDEVVFNDLGHVAQTQQQSALFVNQTSNCEGWSQPWYTMVPRLGKTGDTVDGAPVDMVNIPLFTRFYTSQVVQDFLHQQYEFVWRKWISIFCLG